MLIKSLKILGLFGETQPTTIEFADPVTIIIGPNGSGKTTILKIIDSILNNSIYSILSICFESAEIVFGNGDLVSIVKEQVDLLSTGFSIKRNGKTVFVSKKFEALIEKLPFNLTRNIERETNYERISQDKWRNELTGEVLSFLEFAIKFAPKFPRLSDFLKQHQIDELTFPVKSTFIGTDRLQKREIEISRNRYKEEVRTSIVSPINAYSEKISRYLDSAYSEFAIISQSLDSTYPDRLLNKPLKKDITIDLLQELILNLQNKKEALSTLGISLQMNDIPLKKKMNPTELKAIYLYLGDSVKKLNAFEEFASKYRLFMRMMNTKFGKNKMLSLSKDSGLRVITKTKQPIDLDYLSSGEQHEFILLFELIYGDSTNILLMIDEPEISLHVDWQDAFVSDLLEINKLAPGRQFILATHSPSIISDKNKWCREIL